MKATREELEALQADCLSLLQTVRKAAHTIEGLTETARVTSTLYHRAFTVTQAFERRAAGLQERATNRSIDLSVRRLQHLLLTKRLERLSEIAGDGKPSQIRRAKADLREAGQLIDAWATDPAAMKEDTNALGT